MIILVPLNALFASTSRNTQYYVDKFASKIDWLLWAYPSIPVFKPAHNWLLNDFQSKFIQLISSVIPIFDAKKSIWSNIIMWFHQIKSGKPLRVRYLELCWLDIKICFCCNTFKNSIGSKWNKILSTVSEGLYIFTRY